MNKIEVNPRLFVTCRLCLEDLGQYQIVPEVKQQILYCFDIQVEPFDGLPQLICKKCEAVLNNYSEIKKKFIEKQKDLRDKSQESSNGSLSQVEPKLDIPMKNLENVSMIENLSLHRKRKAYISTSSNDEMSGLWPTGYTKQYVCRICNSRWFILKSLKNHINSKHSILNKKYSHIFKRQCIVRLCKTDGKPNITGSAKKVMHRREKIIMNVNPKYYILYTTKDYKDTDDEKYSAPYYHDERNVKSIKTDKSKDDECSDSSEDEIVFKHKRFRRRLCSRSSNDTVVLDTANKLNVLDNDKKSYKSGKVKTPAVSGECINIDSSDNESENSKSSQKITDKQMFDINREDFKPDQATIKEVISTCQNKYIKKHYYDNFVTKANKNPSDIALQLKRKILSIGRKIINKKIGVNCTPLLRFIEHKNLDITWLPREIVYVNQDSNYIRIMTRMKTNGENCDDETGWTDYTPSQTYQHKLMSDPSRGVKLVEVSLSEPNNVPNGIKISEVASVSAPEIALAESTVSFSDANLHGADTRKLLNANPVANPKQLPKKSVVKSVQPNVEVTPQESNDIEFCVPIITSTTSLAVQFSLEENKDSLNNKSGTTSTKHNDKKSEGPRIKVKPVSELMSVETLSRMQEPVHVPCVPAQLMPVQNENEVVNVYVPTLDVAQFQNTPQQYVTMNVIAPEPAWQNEFMILDTIEMPNTRTNSPFLYLKNLLQLHNIVLLDTDVELSKEFVCLIRFKVLYKQDNKSQPVILCLALFCSKNVFCLKVKDRNQDNLNLTKISPNWQWEVLKIYKGEVVSKLLNNAQKIGQDVFEFTKSFLCLLKSVNLIKMS